MIQKNIYCWGKEKNQTGTEGHTMTKNYQKWNLKVRTDDDLTTIIWKHKLEVFMQTDIHGEPGEGSFYNDQGQAKTLAKVM